MTPSSQDGVTFRAKTCLGMYGTEIEDCKTAEYQMNVEEMVQRYTEDGL